MIQIKKFMPCHKSFSMNLHKTKKLWISNLLRHDTKGKFYDIRVHFLLPKCTGNGTNNERDKTISRTWQIWSLKLNVILLQKLPICVVNFNFCGKPGADGNMKLSSSELYRDKINLEVWHLKQYYCKTFMTTFSIVE